MNWWDDILSEAIAAWTIIVIVGSLAYIVFAR
jgi:hypothetical protein